jgi:hypothetical protein
MFDEELEQMIRDTTGTVETARSEDAAEQPLCKCGNAPIATEGAAGMLQKCRACYSNLQADLANNGTSETRTLEWEEDERGGGGNDENDPDADSATNAYSRLPGENAEAMTIESVEGAMILAMTDSSKSCKISLNGLDETFEYDFDPVNGSKQRKLFKRMSWDSMFQSLYWYIAYGAMISSGMFLLAPCVINLDGYPDGSIVLYAILGTMCNRPRFDGLLFNIGSKDIFIVQNIVSKVTRIHLSAKFDRTLLDG